MKLALGTAQFGLTYGVANTSGQVERSEIQKIISQAKDVGIDMIDTAAAYGDSEARLGQAGMSGMAVVSKLPPGCDQHVDILGAVQSSLKKLGIPQLYGLLLHRSANLSGPDADKTYTELRALKNAGLVKKIGVSIYSPSELDSVMDRFELDLVQAPYNVIDRRLESSGWLNTLKGRGVEIHTRSVFLQGLLLMPAERRPASFDRWSDVLNAWDKWLAETGQTSLSAALGFACGNSMIDRVIVGVDSIEQFDQILAATRQKTTQPSAHLASEDLELIDPSNWTTS